MRRLILIFAICAGVMWDGPVGADPGDPEQVALG